MIFAPRELCEKLVGMGCISESKFSWHKYESEACEATWFLLFDEEPTIDPSWQEQVPAFCFEDFAGCHDGARENADKIFGSDYVCSRCGGSLKKEECGVQDGLAMRFHAYSTTARYYHRHAMIDYTEGPWFDYLAKTMGAEVKKTS